MKRFATSLLVVFCLFNSEFAFASECNTAVSITPEHSLDAAEIDRSFVSETFSGVSECSGPDGQVDAWFEFVASSSNMLIEANGTGNLDLAIEVYASCGGGILDCTNDAGAGASELVSIGGLTSGNTYYFRTYHAAASVADSDDFSVSVAFVSSVELKSIYCGVLDYTTNDIIQSTQPPLGTSVAYYQWRFTELEAPFTVHELIPENPANPNFRLNWFDAIEYGRSYDVSIRIGTYPGPVSGDYGNSCTIKLQDNVLSTQLQAQYGNGIFDFCDIVAADPVGGADKYRWEFNDLVNTTVIYSEFYYRLLRLYQVPGLQLGKTYIVSAFAQVNGMESPVGTLRFLFTNNLVPNTGLRNDFYPCGGSYPLNSQVQAVEICAAESYTWRFRNTSQLQEDLIYTRSDGSRFIRLEWVTGLIGGDNYDLDVKGFQGGLDGDYSAICNITVGEPTNGFTTGYVDDLSEVIESSGEIAEYEPELFLSVLQSGSSSGAPVMFQIASDINEYVTVAMYDLNGRIVDSRQVRAMTDVSLIEWNVQGLTQGIYILKAFTQNKITSRKLSVF